MVQEMPTLFEVASLVVLVAILLADLLVIGRRPHVPSTRECLIWVVVYVGLALVFAVVLLWLGGSAPAGQFVAGWLTEYSLSVDNLFIFMLILSAFTVPREHQQRVLMVGIVLSLVLRAVFIIAGAEMVAHFGWVFYVFGAFLVYTAVTVARGENGNDEEYRDNLAVRVARRVLPISRSYDGGRVRTVVDGRRMFTPLLVVFIAIGTANVLFAFDSIPAIFGLTQDPFIVFTTNVFAAMGLRQIYFLIGGLLERLVYLPYGLAAILGFIGIKMVLEALHTNDVPFLNRGHPLPWAPDIPTWVSLLAIAGALAMTVVVSLIHDRRVAVAEEQASLDCPSPAQDR